MIMVDRNILVSTTQVQLLACLHKADISELLKAGNTFGEREIVPGERWLSSSVAW